MDSIVQTWIKQSPYTGRKSGISRMYKGDDILEANLDNSEKVLVFCFRSSNM